MTYIVGFAGVRGEEALVCRSLAEASATARRLRDEHGATELWVAEVQPVPYRFSPAYEPPTQAPTPDQVAIPAPVSDLVSGPVEPAAPADGDGRPIVPGELTEEMIDRLVAIDEGAADLSADDPVVQEAFARRDRDRHSGLFGR